jgi:hypothetical protein
MNPDKLIQIDQKITIIKRVCASLLLVSFFLPLTRGCSRFEIPSQQKGVNQEEKKPILSFTVKKPRKKYPYEMLVSEGSITSYAIPFLIFGYLWPIPLLFIQQYSRKKVFRYILAGIELSLCIVTFYLMLIISAFSGEMMFGVYLAVIAISLYFCSTGVVLLMNFKNCWKERYEKGKT